MRPTAPLLVASHLAIPFNNNSGEQVLGDDLSITSLAMTYAVIWLGTFVVDRWCQMHPVL